MPIFLNNSLIKSNKQFFRESVFSKELLSLNIFNSKIKLKLLNESNNKLISDGYVLHFKDNKLVIETRFDSGATPFIYIKNNNIVITENISLLTNHFKLSVDYENINEYIRYGYLVSPKTLVNNLTNTPLNCETTINVNSDNKINLSYNYKKLKHGDKSYLDDSDTMKFQNKLYEACNQQSNSDSIFLLSGGIDSSVMYQLMKNYHQPYNRTWSTAYPFFGKVGNIEKEYSISGAQLLGAEQNHHHVQTTPAEYFNSIIEATLIIEEPIHFNQTALFNILFKKIFSNKINKNKIVVNGMAADCLLGTKFHNRLKASSERILWKIFRTSSPWEISILSRLLNRYYKNYSDILRSQYNINDYNHLIWDFNNKRDYSFTNKYFGLNKTHDSRLDIFNRIDDKNNLLNLFTYIDLYGEMALSSQRWTKISKHYGGGGAYFPFLNQSIIEHTFNYDWDVKLKSKKRLLVELGAQIGVNQLILTRPKTGMSVNPKENLEKYLLYIKIIKDYCYDEKLSNIITNEASLKTQLVFVNFLLWKYLVIDRNNKKHLTQEIQKVFN